MCVREGKRESDCENVQDVTYKEEKKSLTEACERDATALHCI